MLKEKGKENLVMLELIQEKRPKLEEKGQRKVNSSLTKYVSHGQ